MRPFVPRWGWYVYMRTYALTKRFIWVLKRNRLEILSRGDNSIHLPRCLEHSYEWFLTSYVLQYAKYNWHDGCELQTKKDFSLMSPKSHTSDQARFLGNYTSKITGLSQTWLDPRPIPVRRLAPHANFSFYKYSYTRTSSLLNSLSRMRCF